MSTPELPGGLPALPAETRFAENQAPRAGDTPSQTAPTPGLSPAVLRSPTAPTLPDWDAGFVQRLANELFAGPAAVPTVPTTSVAPPAPAVAMPSAPPVARAAPAAVPAAPAAPAVAAAPVVPATSTTPTLPDATSPFTSPLKLDAIEAPGLDLASVPLIDGGPHSPLDSAAPYWMLPAK